MKYHTQLQDMWKQNEKDNSKYFRWTEEFIRYVMKELNLTYDDAFTEVKYFYEQQEKDFLNKWSK